MNSKKASILLPVAITVATGVLYGCATEPMQRQSVNNARSEYQQAAQNENIKRNASVALYEAEQQLQKLDESINDDASEAEIDHQAYLVQQRVDIAKAMAQQKKASREIDQLNKERAQIRMDLRQAEVRRAQKKAELAAMEAQREKERAASLQQELQKIQAATFHQEARGTVVTLSDVFFDFGKAYLKTDAGQNLEPLVGFLRANPQRHVVIEGFTDSIGKASYNEKLSQQRARSVIDYLASQGINRNRLAARGYGEAFPVATNENAAGRQLNRRVEIVVLKEGQRPAMAGGPTQPTELVTFSEMDRDRNGYLSKEETRQMQTLRSNFEHYDQNRDKLLSHSEFSAFENIEIQQRQKQRREGQP